MEEVIRFTSSRPGIDDFRMRAAWCPYQHPWEIEELTQWGADPKDVESTVLQAIAVGHSHPYYSIPSGRPIGNRDLVYIAVDLRLPQDDVPNFGYLVFSDRDATTLCIFHQHGEFVFYSDSGEPDENREEMFRMTGRRMSEPLTVAIHARHTPPDLTIPSQFEVT